MRSPEENLVFVSARNKKYTLDTYLNQPRLQVAIYDNIVTVALKAVLIINYIILNSL